MQKQDTEKAVAGGEELRSLHLELCNERARTAFLLSNLSTALDGRYALDPDAAGMHSSCSLNYGLASRQRHWQVGKSRQGLWQVPAPSVATDDGTCEAMTELMALYDSLSAENVRCLFPTFEVAHKHARQEAMFINAGRDARTDAAHDKNTGRCERKMHGIHQRVECHDFISPERSGGVAFRLLQYNRTI